MPKTILKGAVDADEVKLSMAQFRGRVAPEVVAKTAAHIMVHEWLPDVFTRNLYGWPEVKRGGTTPLYGNSGSHILSAFDFEVSGSGARIFNNFAYAWVHDRGDNGAPLVIRPKTKKALSFAVGGEKWAAKSVTIPIRRFMYFPPDCVRFIVEEVEGELEKPKRTIK